MSLRKEEKGVKKEEIISVMKRYEVKFRLEPAQLAFFQSEISKYMRVDKYGLTTIASLYFDTPGFSLITKSIEKPKFKEKIRLRSYGFAKGSSPVFLEIKRKHDDIVYKRRISTSEQEVNNYLYADGEFKKDHISRELAAFKEAHPLLEPKYLILTERVAYYQENSDLRITIDINPRYRTKDLNLHTSMEGKPLLENGGAILEVKVQHSIPVWLVKILTKGKIYKTSFSKVGTAHIRELKKKEVASAQRLQLATSREEGGLRYGFVI